MYVVASPRPHHHGGLGAERAKSRRRLRGVAVSPKAPDALDGPGVPVLAYAWCGANVDVEPRSERRDLVDGGVRLPHWHERALSGAAVGPERTNLDIRRGRLASRNGRTL